MMWRQAARIFVLGVLLGFGSVRLCAADIVTVRFTAEITDVAASREIEELNDDLQRVTASIRIGDFVEGHYAYDTSLPDLFDDYDFGGVYHADVRPCGLVVRTGEFVFQTDPENIAVTIATRNDGGPGIVEGMPRESFTVSSEFNRMLPQIDSLWVGPLSFELAVLWPGDPLPDDSLPNAAPILEDWDTRVLQFNIGANPRPSRESYEHVSFTATLTSVELLPDPAHILYVRACAAAGGDGLSWSSACANLQDAIAIAPTVGNTVIRVAQGTYRPDRGEGLVPGDREAAFHLLAGLAIEGGYAGVEMCPGRREPTRFLSVLDGDLRGDDASGPDATADNSRHVVVAEGVNETAVLDGCVIRGGCAQAIRTSGGGDASQAVDCNACGGALLLIDAGPVIRACMFAYNSASQHGGAVCSLDGSPQFVECRFENNDAQECGGALYARSYGITGLRCVFAGNTARIGGGAFVCGTSRWDHCTLSTNQAEQGSALAYSDVTGNGGVLQLSHCILRDGDAGVYASGSSEVEVSYSNIQGDWPGPGNVDVDPLFADVESHDFHLRSQAGRWDPTVQDWVRDDVTSPCIDAGDVKAPIMDEPFPNGGVINMGAYGGTTEASQSYFSEPRCATIIAGDLDGDCRVDLADLTVLMCHWLEDRRGDPGAD